MHEHRIRQIFPSNGWSYYRHVITQRDCYSMEAITNGLRGMSSSFVHSGLHRTRKKNRKIERRKKEEAGRRQTRPSEITMNTGRCFLVQWPSLCRRFYYVHAKLHWKWSDARDWSSVISFEADFHRIKRSRSNVCQLRFRGKLQRAQQGALVGVTLLLYDGRAEIRSTRCRYA